MQLVPREHVQLDAIGDVEPAALAGVLEEPDDLAGESGALELHREWHAMEEVVGTALRRCNRILAGRRRDVRVPPDLPLVDRIGITEARFNTVIGVIVLVIMLIAFLAGTLPAARAAKKDPIEALRYE